MFPPVNPVVDSEKIRVREHKNRCLYEQLGAELHQKREREIILVAVLFPLRRVPLIF